MLIYQHKYFGVGIIMMKHCFRKSSPKNLIIYRIEMRFSFIYIVISTKCTLVINKNSSLLILSCYLFGLNKDITDVRVESSPCKVSATLV